MSGLLNNVQLDINKVLTALEQRLGIATRDHIVASVAVETLQEQLTAAQGRIKDLENQLAASSGSNATTAAPASPTAATVPGAGQVTELHSGLDPHADPEPSTAVQPAPEPAELTNSGNI